MSEYEEEYEEQPEILTLEEEFELNYGVEHEQYLNYKQFREDEAKRKLAKKKHSELVDTIHEYKQRELLQTDAMGSVTLVMNKNFGEMVECKVLDDNKLETVIGGQKKEIAILHPPMLLTINMRKYWIGGGLFWKIRYFFVWLTMRLTFMMDVGILRFNVFSVRPDGEYTIDPSHDWTPWELKRKVEGYLKLEGRLLKANIRSQLMRDDDSRKQLNNIVYAFLIAMVIIIFFFTWSSGN